MAVKSEVTAAKAKTKTKKKTQQQKKKPQKARKVCADENYTSACVLLRPNVYNQSRFLPLVSSREHACTHHARANRSSVWSLRTPKTISLCSATPWHRRLRNRMLPLVVRVVCRIGMVFMPMPPQGIESTGASLRQTHTGHPSICLSTHATDAKKKKRKPSSSPARAQVNRYVVRASVRASTV